jgi:hypothetical protein
MIQIASSSHTNQTGETRGPDSDAVAKEPEERTGEELVEID